ncbi:cell division protein ZapA [Emticicia sp. SJ17W-69]|uniref:cell division protein ZapA n=1 Tax=Emticicia sp. SJ17W-69 TaxID=3421657 RepID=UPI003EB8F05D
MAESEKLEIGLKVMSRVITLRIQPEMEPYFRKAATLVNQRINSFTKNHSGGEMDSWDFLITVAIEGMVESQKNQDKYRLLQQSLDKRLNDLDNRLTLN